MRVIIFFDLPTDTIENKKRYSKFRKWLLNNGYLMMQFSVYVRTFLNSSQVNNHYVQLQKVIPKNGEIRILTITEKQYSSIKIFSTYNRDDNIIKTDKFIHF